MPAAPKAPAATPAVPKAPNAPAVAAPAGAAADEEQIRKAVIAFVEQYNAHKPDARMVVRNGTEVNGRDAIKASFEEAFAASPKGMVSVVVESLRFLTPDVADFQVMSWHAA